MNTLKAEGGGAEIPLDEFPVLAHGHYANHAAIAPWPRSTAAAVMAFASENRDIGPARYSQWLAREARLRRCLAGLLNAPSADDIALLKNTTEGICTVASGLDWRRGDNLVLPAGEFPSNRLPWLALERLGVTVREVDIRATEQPEEALLAHIDGRTRLLSVSSVRWTDGLRLRLETLGEACRRNGVLFFVDAIQQLGAVGLDVQACQVDGLAADGHKWLLAPEGVAVFYCGERLRETLRLTQLGWHMVDDPYRFEREHWQASRTATRFEAGSPNSLGQAALLASVELLQRVGLGRVESFIAANYRVLSEGLAAIPGVELALAYDPLRASGITSFTVPGKNPREVQRSLARRGLTCALRGGAVRLSPHFYQAGEPVQEMLNVVETAVSIL